MKKLQRRTSIEQNPVNNLHKKKLSSSARLFDLQSFQNLQQFTFYTRERLHLNSRLVEELAKRNETVERKADNIRTNPTGDLRSLFPQRLSTILGSKGQSEGLNSIKQIKTNRFFIQYTVESLCYRMVRILARAFILTNLLEILSAGECYYYTITLLLYGR